MDQWTNRYVDRLTDGVMDKLTDGWTDIQKNTQTDRQAKKASRQASSHTDRCRSQLIIETSKYQCVNTYFQLILVCTMTKKVKLSNEGIEI